MFNLGSDDKDELQENMKEIKDMIQKEDRGSGNREVGGSFGDDSQDFNAEQDQGKGLGQSSPSVPEGSPAGQQKRESSQEQGKSQDQVRGQQSQSSRHDSRETGIPDTGASKSQEQDTQRRQQPEKTSSSQSPGSREVVEQHSQEMEQHQEEEQEDTRREVIRSEPKKEIKKKKSEEPLFLNEEEFREVREMVEEMSYLSREMQDNLDRMKKSVRKERENSKNINELIDAYSERRSSIETAIQTGQK